MKYLYSLCAFRFRVMVSGKRLLAWLAMMTLASGALAQPMGAQGDDFLYRVIQNDTLINISQTFTGTESNWPMLQQLNAVADTHALPIGMELRIPFHLIPELPAQAGVEHAYGRVLHNDRPLAREASVREGDSLSTSVNSFLTLRLPDDSITTIPSETAVRLTRLRTFRGTGLIDAIFELEEGSLESAVAPGGQGAGRYEIRTPVSITGVRGTRLRVHSDHTGTRTEVLSGSAQLGSQAQAGLRLLASQGSAVTADGIVHPARALLPAPRLQPADSPGSSNTLEFEPVAGAVAYQVRVSADAAGMQPVHTQIIEGPPVRYRAPRAGQWHVSVQAIDDLGLMGEAASLAFEGRAMLMTPFLPTVLTGYGDAVSLSDY